MGLMRFVGIELAAQAADEHLDHVAVALEILVVQPLGELGLGDHVAGAAASCVRGCGTRRSSARSRLPSTVTVCARVEHGSGRIRDSRTGPAAGAPQQRLHARQHFLEVIGLGDVVVGAGFEGPRPCPASDRAPSARGSETSCPPCASARMRSSPDSLGSPRSMMATSSGYSLPANRPSSPSAATSTVKPCFTSCSRRPSRNDASSSTTSARINGQRILPVAASTRTVITRPSSDSSFNTYTLRPSSSCTSGTHDAWRGIALRRGARLRPARCRRAYSATIPATLFSVRTDGRAHRQSVRLGQWAQKPTASSATGGRPLRMLLHDGGEFNRFAPPQ